MPNTKIKLFSDENTKKYFSLFQISIKTGFRLAFPDINFNIPDVFNPEIVFQGIKKTVLEMIGYNRD